MSGTETKRYVIKLHQNLDGSFGGYGVHYKNNGQLIGAYPTLERAERAMARMVERFNRMQAAMASALKQRGSR